MRTMLATALLMSSSVLAPPAFSGVKVGDPAPEMQGKEFINTERIGLKDLLGRVILYDIFRTW